MKQRKYLIGTLFALLAVLAFTISSFTKKETKSPTDVCQDSQKKWFMMTMDCDTQGWPAPLNVIRNPLNYVESNQTDVNDLCKGFSCVCAIYACPQWNVAQQRYVPNIGSNTDIYTHLYYYWLVGQTNGTIRLKDQYWGE